MLVRARCRYPTGYTYSRNQVQLTLGCTEFGDSTAQCSTAGFKPLFFLILSFYRCSTPLAWHGLVPGDVVITGAHLTPFAFNRPVTPVPAGTEGTVLGVSPGTGAVQIQFQDVPFPQKVFDCLIYKLSLVPHKTTIDEEEAACSGLCAPAAPSLAKKSRGRTPGPQRPAFKQHHGRDFVAEARTNKYKTITLECASGSDCPRGGTFQFSPEAQAFNEATFAASTSNHMPKTALQHPKAMPEEPTLPGRRVVLAYAFRCFTNRNMPSACTLRELRVVLAYAMERCSS